VPDITEIADAYRKAIIRRERHAALRLITAYGLAWKRLKTNLDKLTSDIKAARDAGEPVNQFWLARQERYSTLLRQVGDEIRKFSDTAESTITKQQELAAKAGLRDSVAMMEAAAETTGINAAFNKLPTSAVENLAGTLGDGSPLRSLIDQLPREARAIVERGLIEGVALGHGPAKIARVIREGLGGNMTRALTISRSETLRAYRQASLDSYRANADVVQGWYWRSSRSRRSCCACIALDGIFFPLSQPMKNHPRCRCTLIPGLKGLKLDTGLDWFKKQPADVRRSILGTNKAYEAVSRGDLKLQDLVGLQRSAQWGESYVQIGVKRAINGEGAFPVSVKAPPRFALTQSQVSLIRNAPPYINEAGKAESDKIDVRYLGFSHSDPFPPGLENRGRKVAVDLDRVELGRPALDRNRLLILADQLSEGLTEKGLRQDPIQLSQKPDGGFVVSVSGNHRVALLKLMGFEGEVEAKAQMQRKLNR
jgi:SPP1 gp7 family putative phage head morphogenesis protein